MSRILLALVVAVAALSAVRSAAAAFVLIANTGCASTGGSGAPCTTAAINTTGADLIVFVQNYTLGLSPSDNQSNTWSTAITRGPTFSVASRISYAYNPSTSASHTFTTTGSGAYPNIEILVFRGSQKNPVDQSSGNDNGSTAGTSATAGSITPSVANTVIVASLVTDNATSALSINSGFTITNNYGYSPTVNEGGAAAYLVQTTPAAVNPTWSWTGSAPWAAAIASFLQMPPQRGLMGVGL